jgi:nucleoside-diphosphate-sugar epimerase
MNIFITGAHGFVGRNLTEYLTRTTEHILLTPKSSELNLLDENAVDEYVSKHNIDYHPWCQPRRWARYC